jgi:hypothetical protein
MRDRSEQIGREDGASHLTRHAEKPAQEKIATAPYRRSPEPRGETCAKPHVSLVAWQQQLDGIGSSAVSFGAPYLVLLVFSWSGTLVKLPP